MEVPIEETALVSSDPSPLARRVAEACLLHGEFVLRSGQTTTKYFDKYRFESNPSLLAEIAGLAAGRVPPATEFLAGLELGGIPVAVALSFTTGLPAVFVRKRAKSYGTAKLAEGPDVAGRQLLVVEDVVTTGGQVLDSVRQLRGLGARVDHVLCIIDRSATHELLTNEGLELMAVFRAEDIERD